MGIIETIKRLGFFSGDRDSTSESVVFNNSIDVPSEYASTVAFNECFEALLEQDKLIARSDYKHLISQYEGLSQFYAALLKSNMLDDNISKHRLDELQIERFFDQIRRY